jgi:hypothetical protein
MILTVGASKSKRAKANKQEIHRLDGPITLSVVSHSIPYVLRLINQQQSIAD